MNITTKTKRQIIYFFGLAIPIVSLVFLILAFFYSVFNNYNAFNNFSLGFFALAVVLILFDLFIIVPHSWKYFDP